MPPLPVHNSALAGASVAGHVFNAEAATKTWHRAPVDVPTPHTKRVSGAFAAIKPECNQVGVQSSRNAAKPECSQRRRRLLIAIIICCAHVHAQVLVHLHVVLLMPVWSRCTRLA